MRPSASTHAACVRVLQRTVPTPHPLSLVPRLDLLALAARREASRRPDARYAALRAEAAEAAATMVRYFKASQDAYARGHGAHAKALSVHGRVYQRYMEACNRNASEWIYAVNNNTRREEVDLHGLFVKEAISYVSRAVLEAFVRGDREVRFIVGRGFFSEDGEPKLRPAVAKLMISWGLDAERDWHNPGVLVVYLDGRQGMFSEPRAASWFSDDADGTGQVYMDT